MRTYEEYHEILTLWEIHRNKKKIARITGIPRATVRDCIMKFGNVFGLEEQAKENARIKGISVLVKSLKQVDDPDNVHQNYAYLFGLYLGDGCISKMNRVHRLRIALDKKYPEIIESCVDVLETLFPDNQIGIVDCEGCVNVSLYHKHLPKIFPQDGDGKKHEREIKLEKWQQRIVDAHPLEFFRGLYHSDGSRSVNWVKGKNYPRYTFSNYSKEILKLFTDTAEKLGLHWTTANSRNVAISRRDDVAWLDEHIGEKA
ncbi:MAG: LAGLIDADG family homing endonuclease [Chloroflexota bacterium]